MGDSLQKPYQTANSCRKQHQNVLMEHSKKANIISDIFWWIQIVSNPRPFLNRGNEKFKQFGGRGTKYLKNHQSKRGGKRENTKFVKVMEFFHCNLYF